MGFGPDSSSSSSSAERLFAAFGHACKLMHSLRRTCRCKPALKAIGVEIEHVLADIQPVARESNRYQFECALEQFEARLHAARPGARMDGGRDKALQRIRSFLLAPEDRLDPLARLMLATQILSVMAGRLLQDIERVAGPRRPR